MNSWTRHPGCVCSLPEPLLIDVMEASGACQPYSVKSGARMQGSDPRDHPGHHSIFGEYDSIKAVTKLVLPHRLMFEEVLGFERPYKRGELSNALAEFEHDFLEIRRAAGQQHFEAFAFEKIDVKPWANGNRCRLSHATYICIGQQSSCYFLTISPAELNKDHGANRNSSDLNRRR